MLIGFSGDDPNFLEWIGWIRDELEDHHAPIYLTGLLSLDHVQRSLLARRGVTPIDLAPVFPNQSESPASAIKWFLENLKIGRPPSPHRWPNGTTVTQETRDYQPALLLDGLSEPEDVRPDQDVDEETAWKILKRWTFERGRYPGWLVALDRVRSVLWTNTQRWMRRLIKFSNGRSAIDRIRIFYELNWRLEISMMPLFEVTKEPFERAVEDLFSSLSGGSPVDPPSRESAYTSSERRTSRRLGWNLRSHYFARRARSTTHSDGTISRSGSTKSSQRLRSSPTATITSRHCG